MYIIEFQKRGLPHAHILSWLHQNNKLERLESIDKFIYAELPDKAKYPWLFKAMTIFMMHGPCSASNPNSSCMKDGKCSKFFSQDFI